MSRFGILFLFSFQCCLFFERSPAGVKRNWECLLGGVLVHGHGAAVNADAKLTQSADFL